MVIDSVLPHMEFGSNDHWEDAPHFICEILLNLSKLYHAAN